MPARSYYNRSRTRVMTSSRRAGGDAVGGTPQARATDRTEEETDGPGGTHSTSDWRGGGITSSPCPAARHAHTVSARALSLHHGIHHASGCWRPCGWPQHEHGYLHIHAALAVQDAP
ncbi:hypothetical protein EON67_06715 [archaeon]|nr:MAG: hypothetical protein EON67_06715 [archaeon]